MTREKAISTLRNVAWLGTDKKVGQVEEALQMAITALQTDGDCISRRGAIQAFMTATSDGDKANWCKWVLEELPSVQPTQPNTSNTLKPLDCVDRQAAIELIKNYCENGCDIAANNWCPSCQREQFIELLKALPSAQPEPCDAISRADAIRVASGYCHPANVAKELAKLPSVQPEPKWIPVTEMLPEYNEAVLTWDGGAFCIEKRIPYIRDDDGEPIESDWWVGDEYDEYESDYYPNLRDGAAIAWMPLPEPYSPGCADKNGGTE